MEPWLLHGPSFPGQLVSHPLPQVLAPLPALTQRLLPPLLQTGAWVQTKTCRVSCDVAACSLAGAVPTELIAMARVTSDSMWESPRSPPIQVPSTSAWRLHSLESCQSAVGWGGRPKGRGAARLDFPNPAPGHKASILGLAAGRLLVMSCKAGTSGVLPNKYPQVQGNPPLQSK